MNKFKIILSIFFLILGIGTAILTFNLSGKDSFGEPKFKTPSALDYKDSIAGAGGGVDSSNDGVAVGLGIISGFSFLSSTLLLTSIQKFK